MYMYMGVRNELDETEVDETLQSSSQKPPSTTLRFMHAYIYIYFTGLSRPAKKNVFCVCYHHFQCIH